MPLPASSTIAVSMALLIAGAPGSADAYAGRAVSRHQALRTWKGRRVIGDRAARSYRAEPFATRSRGGGARRV